MANIYAAMDYKKKLKDTKLLKGGLEVYLRGTGGGVRKYIWSEYIVCNSQRIKILY